MNSLIAKQVAKLVLPALAGAVAAWMSTTVPEVYQAFCGV